MGGERGIEENLKKKKNNIYMDARELGLLLANHPRTRGYFNGVFASDQLPDEEEPGFYVVNTEPSWERGSHWTAIELGVTPHYFDSYGLPPLVEDVASYLPPGYVANTKTLQHPLATTCGQWCIFFVWKRCQGWGMEELTAPFNCRNLLVNDHAMTHMVETEFKTDLEVQDRDFLQSQVNRTMGQYLIRNQDKAAVADLIMNIGKN